MVLTQEELIAALRNEVRILLHLITKIDPPARDYKPTAKQRTTVELLQYLNIMGPQLVPAIRAGAFDGEAWGAAVAATAALDFDALVASIATQADFYARELSTWTEADFRGEVDLFGSRSSRGAQLCSLILAGHAAYRTQLFLYLKASGREELNTMNLWGGVDSAT